MMRTPKKLIKKITEYGIRQTLNLIWKEKVDYLIQSCFLVFLKNKKLKKAIVIESHNDFDCNGGAFYEYLIDNGYNRDYRIIWLLKHPELKPDCLPDNVYTFPLFRPSVLKDYYICISKILLADNIAVRKRRTKQISVYCTHGAGGLKNVRGKCDIPDWIDYVLIQSPRYAPIQAYQYGIEDKPEKMVYLGYPIHDVLNRENTDELLKITRHSFSKVVLWMPTFRKGGGDGRNDSCAEQPLGVPLIDNIIQYDELNGFLSQNNMLLIIKIHPMQDLSTLHISNKSNIVVLSGLDVKRKHIDNYRLMSCSDALISDYSGAAYDYLQLDKPIGYVLSDMEDYKLGFVIDDISKLLAGPSIYSTEDLFKFLACVKTNNDDYAERRMAVRDYIYEYHDTNNCARLAEFLHLKKQK